MQLKREFDIPAIKGLLKRNFNIKRSVDLAIAVPLFTCTLPITIPIAAYMAIETKSSPIFKQKRIGLNGEESTLYKIRTMSNETDELGHLLPDDERTSKIGEFVRKTHLDEFIQFGFNVIPGSMSVVGPRPAPAHEDIAHDKLRQQVKPGITGWAQMTVQNAAPDDQKLEADHKYIRCTKKNGFPTLIIDPLTVALTIPAIFRNWEAPHSNKNAQLSNNAPNQSPPETQALAASRQAPEQAP